MKTTTIALAAALLATSATASAESATDARCLVLSNAFAQQTKDANQQKLAEDSIYFYLGRINGQPSATQMKTLLEQQAKTITDATAGTLMGDCVKAVQAKVELLQSLSQQAKPQAKPPAQPQGR
jgi:fructoselysine-6-P-deglycase FrlB-like protein